MSPVQTASKPIRRRDARPDIFSAPSVEPMPPALEERAGALTMDREFIAMRTVYRATGGVARGDDLALWLQGSRSGDYVSLTRLIVSGQIFSFGWHHTFWVPMFQFEPRDLSVKPGPRQVLDELAGAFDGWQLANWFAQPNSWLHDRRPVELLDSNLAAVVQAARADRFIATG